MPDTVTCEPIPTRRSLLSRLKNAEDQESWREFFNTYWRLIYHVAVKSGLTEGEAQEVVQDTVLGVWKQMETFHYDPQRGSFKNWLLGQTRWRILDQYRKRRGLEQAPRPESASATGTGTIERIPDPGEVPHEQLWDEEWRRNLTAAALDRVKRKVKAKQFQIFHLYVIKQWPAQKVARALGVSLARIYLARHRVGRLMKQEIEMLEQRLI